MKQNCLKSCSLSISDYLFKRTPWLSIVIWRLGGVLLRRFFNDWDECKIRVVVEFKLILEFVKSDIGKVGFEETGKGLVCHWVKAGCGEFSIESRVNPQTTEWIDVLGHIERPMVEKSWASWRIRGELRMFVNNSWKKNFHLRELAGTRSKTKLQVFLS